MIADRRHRMAWKRLSLALSILIGIPSFLEFTARQFGWGRPEFRWFSDASILVDRPVFVPFGGMLRTDPLLVRADHFRRIISKEKYPNTVRIFFIGDSTTEGWPYLSGSYPDWTRAILRDVAPASQIEIINAGFHNFDSTRLLSLTREILDYQPDIVVFRGGYDDYMTFRLRHGSRIQQAMRWAHSWLVIHSNMYNLFLSSSTRPTETAASRILAPASPGEIDQLLSEYDSNIETFIFMVQSRGAKPILLGLPFTNRLLGPKHPFTNHILPAMNASLKRIALAKGVPLIELPKMDNADFIDSVHSSLEGNRKIGLTVAKALCEKRLKSNRACDWDRKRPDSHYRRALGLFELAFLSHYHVKMGLYYLQDRDREQALVEFIKAEKLAPNAQFVYEEIARTVMDPEVVRLLVKTDLQLGFNDRAENFQKLLH